MNNSISQQRPSGITILSLCECVGVLSCIGLLFFTRAMSPDGLALSLGVVLGIMVVYGLWTLQYWAFWFTAIYEAMEIAYELFLVTQPAYRNIHLLGPLFGIILSVMTLGYLFLDRSVKPVFRRGISS